MVRRKTGAEGLMVTIRSCAIPRAAAGRERTTAKRTPSFFRRDQKCGWRCQHHIHAAVTL